MEAEVYYAIVTSAKGGGALKSLSSLFLRPSGNVAIRQVGWTSLRSLSTTEKKRWGKQKTLPREQRLQGGPAIEFF